MYGALALDNYGALALDNGYDRRKGRFARNTEDRHLKIKGLREKYREMFPATEDNNFTYWTDDTTEYAELGNKTPYRAYRAELDAKQLKVFGKDENGNNVVDAKTLTATTLADRKKLYAAKIQWMKDNGILTMRRGKGSRFITRGKMGLVKRTVRNKKGISGRGYNADGSKISKKVTLKEGDVYYVLTNHPKNERIYNRERLLRKARYGGTNYRGSEDEVKDMDFSYKLPESQARFNPFGGKDAEGNQIGGWTGEWEGPDKFYNEKIPGAIYGKGSGSIIQHKLWGDVQKLVNVSPAVRKATAGKSYGYRPKGSKASAYVLRYGLKTKRRPKNVPPSFTLTEEHKKAMQEGAKRAREWKAAYKAEHPGATSAEVKAAYAAHKAARSNPRKPRYGTKAYYRAKHRLANKNPMGALALDNYGALALDNPLLDDAKSSAISSAKLIGFGLVGGLAHALVGDKIEDIIEKVPVIGERALDLAVPEAVPVIGGMELENTVVGFTAGTVLGVAGLFARGKVSLPVIGDLGSVLMAIGAGAAAVGPAMDIVAHISGGAEDVGALALDNYGALALDNYGGLALDNEGTFGDGMAYQIGQIAQDNGVAEFEQASLADAHYSGADFDLGEGEALINGRKHFFRRFGHPTRRIHSPGHSVSASHLAGQPGHRWGWLIKMIGWSNTRKLAAMPPAQRVSTIKQLRENALATFQQIQAQQAELSAGIAAPELGPVGADGVSGAFGTYGATLFSGEGL